MIKNLTFIIQISLLFFSSQLYAAQDIDGAVDDAKESMGQMFMDMEKIDTSTEAMYEMGGVQGITSAGSLLGGDTSISGTLVASRTINCVDGATVYLASLYITVANCIISSGSVSSINFEYCQSADGSNCDGVIPIEIDVTTNGFERNTSTGSFKTTCNNLRCELTVVNAVGDEFDSNDMRDEAEDREAANPSAVTEAFEATQNSQYWAQDRQEASDSADYINRASDAAADTGFYPVYRNSDSDIAQFGEREAVIAVDLGDAGEPPECTTIGVDDDTETCNANYAHVEYVCNEPKTLCSFERKKEIVTGCGRALSVQCASRITCNDTNVTDRKSNPTNNSSSEMDLEYDYPVIKFNSKSRWSGEDRGDQRMQFYFNIDDMADITSFKLTGIRYEDFASVVVNSYPSGHNYDRAFLGPRNDMVTLFGGYTIESDKWCAAYKPSGDSGTFTCSLDNQGITNWTGEIDLYPWLKEGYNYVYVQTVVMGSGEVQATFELEQTCGCNWSETWGSSTCEAENIVE